MWSSSKTSSLLYGLAAALALLAAAGCMADRPGETDIPWAAPASWEGTMPLPGGYIDRYQ